MAERSISVRLSARVEQYVAAMAAAQKSTGLTVAQINNIEKVGGKLQGVGRTMTTSITAPLTAMAAGAVMAATSWESAWAGVTKTVDGTAEEMAALEQGLRDMAKELPATHAEIAAVAEAAGQLGVGVGDIEAFTRVMIDLGETTNLTADEAATALARFMNIMGTSQDNVQNLGSTIVGLGNNFATTEAEIVTLGTRLAAAGRIAGLSESDVLGFATALTSVGVEAEAGGTALSKVFVAINDAVLSSSDKLDVFAQVAGTSAESFARSFRESPAQAIAMFIDGLGRMAAAGQSTTGVFSELELTDQRLMRALLSTGQAQGLLTEALGLGAQAWQENTALTDEAAKRYETTAAQFEMVRNKIVDLFIDIGEIILPIVAKVVDVLGTLAEKFQSVPKPIQAVVVALGGLAAAAGPVIFIAGSLLKNWQTLSLAFGKSVGPVGTASKALGVLGIVAATAYQAWQILGEGHLNSVPQIDSSADALIRATSAGFAESAAAGAAAGEINSLALAHKALSLAISENADDELSSAFTTLNIAAEDTLGILIELRNEWMNNVSVMDGATTAGARLFSEFFGKSVEDGRSFMAMLYQTDATTAQLAATFGVSESSVAAFVRALDTLNTTAIEGQGQIADLALAYLDSQVALGGAARDAVLAAEAVAGLRIDGENAIAVYEEFVRIIGEMSPAEREAAGVTDDMAASLAGMSPEAVAAALGLDEVGAAAGEMADKVDTASIDVRTAAQRMAESAQDFEDAWIEAIDSFLTQGMGLYDAKQRLWEVAQGFEDAIDGTSRSLAMNTEEGRQNADALQEWARGIAEHTQELIDSGENAVTVANDYAHNRNALLDNAEALGFNREEVEELLREWGLMPSLVSTTYNMAGISAAREQVQLMLDQIEEIPPEAATEIQALIDQGKYDEAIAYLDALQNPLIVPVDVRVRSVPRIGVSNGQVTYDYGARSGRQHQVALADGGFLTRPTVALAGEAGTEGVYPLTRPHRLDAMMSNPMSAPIWASMARVMGGMSGGGGDTVINVNVANNGRDLTAQDVARAVAEAVYS